MGWRRKPRKLYLEKLFSTYQPRKLYCGLRVEFNQVILHVWQGGRKLTPAKYEYSFNEFRTNNSMLELIQIQLGPVWLSQMLALITGKATSLLEMPEQFLKDLAQYLTMSDLLRVSSTCKYMNKFYSSDEIWKQIFEKFLRSICNFSDYQKVQNDGGYKPVCRKICLENHENDHTKSLLHSDHIIMGSSKAKMFLSFSNSGRFEQCVRDSPKHSQSTPLLECDEQYEFMPRTNKSETRIQFGCETIIKSQTYQAVPSNSTSSLNHCSTKNDGYQEQEANHGCDVSDGAGGGGGAFGGSNIDSAGNESRKTGTMNENCLEPPRDEFYFSKADLMRRLNYLENKAKKFECDDNCLPGDRTTNNTSFILRQMDYRLGMKSIYCLNKKPHNRLPAEISNAGRSSILYLIICSYVCILW